VALRSASDVDAQVLKWLKAAYAKAAR
jgi:hypothetical protein